MDRPGEAHVVSTPSIVVNLWRPVRAGSLFGFATVTLSSGLVVHDVAVYVSNGKRWAAPPAKPRLARDKRQVTLDGKLQWDAVISFSSKGVRDSWSRQIVEAVLRAYPNALNDDSGAP
jgi:hypothetical protein